MFLIYFKLNANKIENFDDMNLLAKNSELTIVYLTGNPVADYPGYRQKIIELLPKIEQIDSYFLKIQFNVHGSK